MTAWQYNQLKVTAAVCLDNYRATRKDFYLTRAMEYIARALQFKRGAA
jgi:hypothetical protein